MIRTFRATLAGLATYVPGYEYLEPTGGTSSARYCYSVWLRHLVMAYDSGLLQGPPATVAELGPGDSIGIGLAALLSGARKYHALDVVSYASSQRNLAILNELISLFECREPIPDQHEFPEVKPYLASYAFPHHILTEPVLARGLAGTRLERIRQSVCEPKAADGMVLYAAPWNDPQTIEEHAVDMIYSQAVLEHVNDLAGAYAAMQRWLKPTGFVSHQIDFKSHGKAATWDGHWKYSDGVWRIIVGRRPYLLNREPYSTHVYLLERYGFHIVKESLVHAQPGITREELAPRFQDMSDDDMHICGAYVLATNSGA